MLACIKAKDFDDALGIANDTEYGLTGAVYTTHRDRLEKAKAEYFVGNLYTTASAPAPWSVSTRSAGSTCRARIEGGGRDYLVLFTQAKAISQSVGD